MRGCGVGWGANRGWRALQPAHRLLPSCLLSSTNALAAWPARLQASLRSLEHTLGLVGQQDISLVQLQQSVAPAFTPPASLARMLQRIAAKQVSGVGKGRVVGSSCAGPWLHNAPAPSVNIRLVLCWNAD